MHFFHLFCCHLVFAMAPVAFIRTAAQRAASASRWEEPFLVLPCVVSWLVLSCLALTWLALPWLDLTWLDLTCIAWTWLNLSSLACLALLRRTLPCLALPYVALSLVLFWSCFLVLFLGLVLSCVLSCYCLVLSCLVSFCLVIVLWFFLSRDCLGLVMWLSSVVSLWEFFQVMRLANPFRPATQPSSQSRTLVSRSMPRMGGDHGHVNKKHLIPRRLSFVLYVPKMTWGRVSFESVR